MCCGSSATGSQPAVGPQNRDRERMLVVVGNRYETRSHGTRSFKWATWRLDGRVRATSMLVRERCRCPAMDAAWPSATSCARTLRLSLGDGARNVS